MWFRFLVRRVVKEEKTNLRKGNSEIGGTIMCSSMLTLQAGITRTSLVQCACCDIFPAVHEKDEAEFHLLHLNWLPVTDTNGNLRLQMQWVVDR